MAVFKRNNSPFYFVGFEHQGKRYRVSARTTSRRQAEQYEAQLRTRVYDEGVLGKTTHEPMRFEDAVKRYVTTHLKTKMRLEKTASSQAYVLARLVRLIGPDAILDEITTEVVANVKEQVFDAGRKKPSTANQYLAFLRAILRMAHLEWNRLGKMPRFRLSVVAREFYTAIGQLEYFLMTSAAVRALFSPLTAEPGSCLISPSPMPERKPRSFWTDALPHKQIRDRTRQMVEAYLQVAARNGSVLSAEGIRLADGTYLQPDRAVMNSAISHGLLALDDATGVFRVTPLGWSESKRV